MGGVLIGWHAGEARGAHVLAGQCAGTKACDLDLSARLVWRWF